MKMTEEIRSALALVGLSESQFGDITSRRGDLLKRYNDNHVVTEGDGTKRRTTEGYSTLALSRDASAEELTVLKRYDAVYFASKWFGKHAATLRGIKAEAAKAAETAKAAEAAEAVEAAEAAKATPAKKGKRQAAAA